MRFGGAGGGAGGASAASDWIGKWIEGSIAFWGSEGVRGGSHKGQQEMYGLLRDHLNHLMEGQELMAAIEPSQLYGYFHNIVYNSQCNSPNANYFPCFYLGCGLFLFICFS